MSRGSWHSSRAHASSTARLWNEDVFVCEDIEEPPPPDEAPPAFSPACFGSVLAGAVNGESGSSSSAGKNTAISAFRVCLKFLSAARNAQSARPCAAGNTVWLAHTTTASHRYSETAAPSRRERRNAGPAFSRRIRNSSSDSVFPRATAGFVRSPGFFASLHSARNTRNASSSSAKKADASGAEAEGASEASAASPDAESRREPETSSAAESSPRAIRSFPNDSSVRRPRFAGVASPSLSNSLSVTSRCCAAADAGTHSTMSSVSSPAAAAATAVRSVPTLLMKPCTKLVICAAASSSVGFTAFAAASAAADTPPRVLNTVEVDSSEVGRLLPRLARLLEKTSATTMTGGGGAERAPARDRVSSRWNTTASICVRLALAVVWLTSDAEPRYALTHARTTRRSARARTRNVDELTAVSRHLSICNSTVSSGTSEAAQTNSTSSAACASALTLRVFSRGRGLVEAPARSSPNERRSGVDIGKGSGGLALGSGSGGTEGAAFSSSSPAAFARAGGGRSASPRRSPCAMSFWIIASVASMIFGDLLAMASRTGTRRSATRSSGRPPPPPADLSSGFLLSRSDVDETTNAPVCSDATSLLTASASSACRFFPAVASRIFARLSPITSFTSIVAISPRRWVARDSLGSVFHAKPDSPSRPAPPLTDRAPLKQTPSNACLNLGDAEMDAPRAGTAARRALSASGCQDVHRTERHAQYIPSNRARWRVSHHLVRTETDAADASPHSRRRGGRARPTARWWVSRRS